MRVLFVCLGNICRSPAAEGVFRKLVADRGLSDEIDIDSAGTSGYHHGEPADARMRTAATQRGYDLRSRSRRLTEDDLEEFDLVIAMDRKNLKDIREMRSGMAPEEQGKAQVKLLSEFLPAGAEADVPDPYYGGDQGFETVLDMLEQGAENILHQLLETRTSAEAAPL